MSRRDELNAIARRQLKSLGSGQRYTAARLDNLNIAKAWIENELGLEDYDLMDVLATAEYLSGDRATPKD